MDKSAEQPNSAQWWGDLDSIVKKGRELGIEARPGETRDQLYRRVLSAIKDAA